MLRTLPTTPDMMAALAPLSSYENSCLKELVEHDSKVDEYVRNMSQSKFIEEAKDEKMAQNKSIADYNLSLQPAFERGKLNLKELSAQISDLCQRIQEKEQKMKGDSSTMSAETALALLQTSAAESEEGSEKVAELFYQKEMDVDDFLEQFQETRKRMHLRRVKAEKMVELVAQKTAPPRRSAPPPPYPVGPTFPFKK